MYARARCVLALGSLICGVCRSLSTRTASRQRALMLAAGEGSTLSDLQSLSSQIAIDRRRESLRAKNRCERCFMTKTICVCRRIEELWEGQSRPRTRIAILYHYKEWGRASNTGKLLEIGLGPGIVQAFIFGNPAHEKALNDLLLSRPSAVLFPGPKSVPPQTVLAEWGQLSESESPISATASAPVLCLLDGTWTQASSLDKVVDSRIPRLALDSLVSRPSDFLSRKQSSPTRVSTIEAASLALAQLGEDEAVAECVSASLRLSVDAIRVQGGKDPAFDNVIRPVFFSSAAPLGGGSGSQSTPSPTFLPASASASASASAVSGPFTKPTINKPVKCECCGVSEVTSLLNVAFKGFRNMGVRRPWDEEKQQRGEAAHRVWECRSCGGLFNSPLGLEGL